MKRGSLLFDPVPNVACKWSIRVTRSELYVTCALLLLPILGREDPEAAVPDDSKGLPRDIDRRSRVRRMYSLRHDASAVSRVNNRLSERKLSLSSESSDVVSSIIKASAPGKKREKAILQACGVVTSWWNRLETSDTSDNDEGDR